MKELILTVGLPRSGKSTWAILTGFPIVNPDSIRQALHGKPFLKDAEPMVWVIAKYMVKSLFLAGHDRVVVDATNTTQKRRDEWESKGWAIKLAISKTDKRECIVRAKTSSMEFLIPIIESMNEKADFWNIESDYK